MAAFFKLVLRGFLYALGLPFFIIALAIYSLVCLIFFLVEGVRSIFVFFKGGTPFGDLKEDVEAKKILLEKQNAPDEKPQQSGTNIYIFQQPGASLPNPNDLSGLPNHIGEFDASNKIDQLEEKGDDIK